jgi:hypothetical protein
MGLRRPCQGQIPEEAAKFCVWAVGSMQADCIQRVDDWCTKANSYVSPRKSALEKGTTEGGYSSAPIKLFKDLVVLTGRSEPRVPPEAGLLTSREQLRIVLEQTYHRLTGEKPETVTVRDWLTLTTATNRFSRNYIICVEAERRAFPAHFAG